MSKSTQINKRLIAKIPTPGNDTTYLGTNSVGTTHLQDASVTYEKLDPNASFKNVMQGGSQNFVDTQNVLVATTSTGTPAAGFFHSTVVNRKSIVDISQDLKVRMGIERIQIQALTQLQDEFGSSGQVVYSTVNDVNNLIRFVGSTWSNVNNASGLGVSTNNVNDFVEITFYGTGLNALMYFDTNNNDVRASVDGGTEAANFIPTSKSAVLANRNTTMNGIFNVVSGLTLGVHTVKLRLNSIVMNFSGFEILNEVSTLIVNQGAGYSFGKKLTLAAQQSPAYNSGFDSGTLGTKGGRVLCYQNSVGNFGRIVNPTNASLLTLSSSDHTNEDVARTYFPREFGANRTDDFSATAAGAAKSFTLDDGTTSLYTSNVAFGLSSNGTEGASLSNANSTYGTFTFVGTGLDVEVYDSANGGADTYTYQMDGATAVAWPYSSGSTIKRTVKIASGLPYGTHTFRINRVTAATFNVHFIKFIVYQPKKPTLPVGAIELGEYNIMADYVAAASAAVNVIGTGTLRKMSTREHVMVGTWTQSGGVADSNFFESGFNLQSNTATNYFEYTFWGAGIAFNSFVQASQARNHTSSIDGSSNLSGFTTSFLQNGNTGLSFTAATGVISGTSSGTVGKHKLQISGLTLGKHTIRVTYNSGDPIYADCFDIITPIHSYKSNNYADIMNTLTVGSCGILDGRKLTPVKKSVASKKNWVQAVGVASGPTTTSTSAVPCPDMSVIVETEAGEELEIFYRLDTTGNVANDASLAQAYVDGVAVGVASAVTKPTANGSAILVDSITIPVSPGIHKVDLYWWTTANTMTAGSNRRIIKARAT